MKKVLITPEMAQHELSIMGPNRNPARATVLAYARAMKDGKWRCHPMLAIKYDQNGQLIDGQHRMLAVIEAGIPVEFFCDNTDSATLDLFHETRTRTVSHRVAISGACTSGHAGLYASLGKLLVDRKRGGVLVSKRDTFGQSRVSLEEMQEAYEWLGIESLDDLFTAVSAIYRTQPRLSRRTTPTAIAYLVCQVGQSAERFVETLVNDEAEARCESALTFRRQVGNNRYSASERLCLMSLAYNNKTSKVLRCQDYVPDLIGSRFH